MKLDTILKKVQSHESIRSPPPAEPLPLKKLLRKKPQDKFGHVSCKVDTTAPLLRLTPPLALRSTAAALRLQRENMMLLRFIRNNHFTRGRVDSRWRVLPPGSRQYHAARVEFSKRTHAENKRLYKIFTTASPRLTPTAELEQWWSRITRERHARGPWLLAPPAPQLDPAFLAPEGVIRPRVSISLRIRGGAALGELKLELFSEACARTAAIFIALLPAYVGSAFHRAIEHFYRGEAGAARYKLVRVCDSSTLHDFLTLAQQQLQPQEELLLVELRVPMAGALDLGAVRAPAPAAVAAATAALPPPRHLPRQPNLQALLSTNELSHELRKILISLVEAGARLAAAGPHYERALGELRAALQPPRPATRPVVEVITPEEIARRIAEEQEQPHTPPPVAGSDAYRRAEHLQRSNAACSTRACW
ncbi:uncharacterized protein LOC133531574 [Cydia pomonella]|uniref:uncharacterized protein LOC133531574 n=1 Tax=Cydia pomonella TaxID=82600 RepID=UPI002ADE7082|nr:uncharacterized protein LOC133531574 [Cydia pomonella]